ncbi:MAG: DUF1232 domain-containing protein [Bacteroidetes bacterium]|nr:DUF1232 domain-containing protein [Bacteroidota bacterium]
MKEVEEIDFDYEKPKEFVEIETKSSEDQEKYIDENLWKKLERVGKKISFAKDILALVNYMRDPNVSWHRKSIIIGALIYFIVPIDAIPDIAPLIGYLDDLGVIAAVLKYLGNELIPYYDKDYKA